MRLGTTICASILLAAWGGGVAGATDQGVDMGRIAEHMACIEGGGESRDCAIRTGFMDGETFDRQQAMQSCISDGGDRETCLLQSGMATEDEIAEANTARVALSDYLRDVIARATVEGTPQERIAAVELLDALDGATIQLDGLSRPQRREFTVRLLADLPERFNLAAEPELALALLRVCRAHARCPDLSDAMVRALDESNLRSWRNAAGGRALQGQEAIRAAAASTHLHETFGDSLRRVTALLERDPPPEGLADLAVDGAMADPSLRAFAIAYTLVGDHPSVVMGQTFLQRECREHADTMAEECFRIGELKTTQSSALWVRRVGSEMMAQAAWNDDTRERAGHAVAFVEWMDRASNEVLRERADVLNDVAFVRDVLLEDGAADVALTLAILERAGERFVPVRSDAPDA